MRLTTPELRSRAAAFARDWATAHYEKGETQSFWNDFFRIFGIDRKRVAVYEHSVDKLKGGKGFIDLFWSGTLIIEQKSLGKDLLGARIQAMDYTHGLTDAEMPKYILACDFRTWELTSLETDERTAFTLEDLPKHIDKFSFILGRQTRVFKDQDPVNIKAAELVGALHDALEASGYTGHRLEVFLTRIVFCLFADDTGIFEPKDILWEWLDSIPDAESMGPKIGRLFEVLNTDEKARQKTLPEDLARFPYVNGHLFEAQFPTPDFNDDMRTALLNACRFDWTPISPAIFGSLFQSVMDKAERRKKGAHYTTEKNILKLIGPLFLDDLRAEFARLKALKSGRAQRLAAYHDKLAGLTFFDPACGCGNFLVITYRELRVLELDLLLTLHPEGQRSLDAATLSRIDVDQFYGIEIEEFPARIAETALWMMDHLMNLRLSEAFGGYYPRIPLKKSPTILHGDALEADWATVLPPERCSYILGNPPFVGAKFQSQEQREQVRTIANLGKSGGTLDFVCAWFLKAGAYVAAAASPPTQPPPQGGRGAAAPSATGTPNADPSPPSPRVGEGRGGGAARTPPRIAFVSTNSITQGEQVAQLWPLLFDRYNLEIAFAHRTFEWGSDARGKAHVHVVILGLDRREAVRAERRLFSYPKISGEPVETVHKAISPYLFDASNVSDPRLVVKEIGTPVNGFGALLSGSQPIDDGNFTLDEKDRREFLSIEPNAEKYLRPYVAAKDFLQGGQRWVIVLKDASPTDLKGMPELRRRIAAVRTFREQSPRDSTRAAAKFPSRFSFELFPENHFLVLPKVSSERREYMPIAIMQAPSVPSDLVFVLNNSTLTDFALLTSAMHMSWLRHIGGRLKSDYRYSIGLVYNTFPLPPNAQGGTAPALRKLEPLAQAILDARASHPGATLATLYDPDLMPANLRKAHTDLDRAVDRLYRPAGFASDRERVEHLFALYEAMVAPLLAQPKKGRARKSVAKG
jgi:hypothetical protein